jgi:hypothetical protein
MLVADDPNETPESCPSRPSADGRALPATNGSNPEAWLELPNNDPRRPRRLTSPVP